jgi:hypothetical protein
MDIPAVTFPLPAIGKRNLPLVVDGSQSCRMLI